MCNCMVSALLLTKSLFTQGYLNVQLHGVNSTINQTTVQLKDIYMCKCMVSSPPLTKSLFISMILNMQLYGVTSIINQTTVQL